MKAKRFLRIVAAGMITAAVFMSGCTAAAEKTESDSTQNSSVSEASTIESSTEISEKEQSNDESQTGVKLHFKDIDVGDSYDLSREFKDEKLTYKSENPEIAEVDEKGDIHAKKAGSVYISVIRDGKEIDRFLLSVVSGKETSNKTPESSAKENSVNESSAQQSSEVSAEESSKPTNKNTITPAAWKVTDSSGNVMYMMGTIHAADKDAANLPDYFENAFSQCDSLAVECDITKDDTASSLMYLSKYMYSDGTTIKDHISAKAYKTAQKILSENNLYSSLVDNYKPILWVQFMELIATKKAGMDEKYGVDRNLLNRAKQTGREILELESAEFQLQLIADVPDETQELMLELEAKDGVINELTKQLKDTYDDWKNGKEISDETSDEEYAEEGLSEHQIQLLKDYNRTLLDDRNVGMADKAEQYLKDGKKVMLVVGSAHFYGENGLLNLMKAKGCKVESLRP